MESPDLLNVGIHNAVIAVEVCAILVAMIVIWRRAKNRRSLGVSLALACVPALGGVASAIIAHYTIAANVDRLTARLAAIDHGVYRHALGAADSLAYTGLTTTGGLLLVGVAFLALDRVRAARRKIVLTVPTVAVVAGARPADLPQ